MDEFLVRRYVISAAVVACSLLFFLRATRIVRVLAALERTSAYFRRRPGGSPAGHLRHGTDALIVESVAGLFYLIMIFTLKYDIFYGAAMLVVWFVLGVWADWIAGRGLRSREQPRTIAWSAIIGLWIMAVPAPFVLLLYFLRSSGVEERAFFALLGILAVPVFILLLGTTATTVEMFPSEPFVETSPARTPPGERTRRARRWAKALSVVSFLCFILLLLILASLLKSWTEYFYLRLKES